MSFWLDLCRVIAALVVFIGHSRVLGVAPPDLSLAWHRTADDAVIAFFVISGLVIAHTTSQANNDVRRYALARLSRVYSVAIPAVLAALAIDLVGIQLDATHYEPDWQYPKLWLYLPLHWLFLGETWFGAIHPFSMAPYWSLGYEVWYYLLFGCLIFLRGRTRWLVCAAVVVAMGPRILLLLPCWLLGVWVHRNLARLQCSAALGRGLMAVGFVGYVAFLEGGLRSITDDASRRLYAWFNTVLPVPFDPGSTVHVVSDHVVAVLFALFVVGCANSRVVAGPRLTTGVRKVADFTFTFYLIHFSLLVFMRALGVENPGWGVYTLNFAVVLASTWALAQVGEMRRDVYRRAFSAILNRLSGR